MTDFREACCRQYEMGECTRAGFCNFMHLKPISRKLRHELYGRSGNRGGGADFGRGDRLVAIIWNHLLECILLSTPQYYY